MANENVDENKYQILSAGRVKPLLESISYPSASDHENHTRNMYLNTRGAKIHKFSNRVPYCVTSETQ